MTEALRNYERLDTSNSRIAGYLADVQVRRGLAHACLGSGASAVVDVQAGIISYIRFASPSRLDHNYFGLARVLMIGADVLGAYGDPDVALAAAQTGVSWLITALQGGTVDPEAESTTAYLVGALSVEIEVLTTLFRSAETVNARSALTWLGAQPVTTLTGQRRAQSPCLSAATRGLEATVHELTRTDPAHRDLVELLLTHPIEPVCVPVFRTQPEQLIPAARTAGKAANSLFRSNPSAAMRLGLEAHYLLAFALERDLGLGSSSIGTAAGGLPRPQPGEFADIVTEWALLLRALANQFERAGDLPMGRDLRSWSARVSDH
ncbi:hypothetical protein GCM10022236_01220 [Microlunatus ginsengisoli]|uniref:Uncharacterized protein n=1 Tax=Microlunatus ginsengisoli TaxID=363863 RepID=A0ABP6ZCW7_9ACTN